jgi:hypothetical protein
LRVSDRTERVCEIICWVAAVILILATLAFFFIRILPWLFGVIWLFIITPMSWWLRLLTATGFLLLLYWRIRVNVRGLIPRNTNFALYRPNTKS